MAKRTVEVFTAGCPVCEEAVAKVNSIACPDCEVVIHDLNRGCATNECREKAKKYGVKRLPAVAVDGRLLDCCSKGAVEIKELEAAGVGDRR